MRNGSLQGSEVFLNKVAGDRAVTGGGDDLPQRFGAHVADREDTRQRGSRRFIRGDVSMIQFQLSFKQSRVGQLANRDEDAVAAISCSSPLNLSRNRRPVTF